MSKKVKLEVLRKEMARKKLPLKKSATSLVFGKGDPDAKIFFIGEAPGKNEDIQGRPFVGMAGRHLDNLLNSIALSRDEIYITSILKYRPPKNRAPRLHEIKAHTPFLVKQIQIIRPKFIVPLGNFATRFVLAKFDIGQMTKVPGITGLHGRSKAIQFQTDTFTVFPLYHPAAALYNSGLKLAMLRDFKRLKKIF